MDHYEARREHESALPTLAVDLADAFGDGWRAEVQHSHLVHVISPDGVELYLSLDWRDANRVEIRGSFPRIEGVDLYGITGNKIGVSLAKSPAAIAKEVQRRLMPLHLPEVAKYRAKVAEHERRATATADVIAELAALFGKTPSRYDRSATEARFYLDGPHVEVRGNHVRIEHLSGDIDRLRPVLAAIAAMEPTP